jgi:hypothetical protein
MPNYIFSLETEDTFMQSGNEGSQQDNSPIEQNTDKIGNPLLPQDSELNNDEVNIDDEDEINYYSLPENTQNDSKLLIILTIGTLISLGILANSILT